MNTQIRNNDSEKYERKISKVDGIQVVQQDENKNNSARIIN